MSKEDKTIKVLLPVETKKKERLVIPVCVYANWKFCWQRNVGPNHTYWVAEYCKPDTKECAACLGALMNWGQGADRRPLDKAEVKKEREEYKNAK